MPPRTFLPWIRLAPAGPLRLIRRLALALLVSAGLATGAVQHVGIDGPPQRDGSAEAPWTSVEEALRRSAAGDVVRLRRGDVFREAALTVSRRTLEPFGDPSLPPPRITGARVVQGWTPAPGRPGVWQAAFAAGTPAQLLGAGRWMTLARYPNSGWLFQDDDRGDNVLNDAALRALPSAAPGYWVGARLRWRLWSWWHETRRVTADTGSGQLTLDGKAGFAIRGDRTGCGYFLEGRLSELDAPEEWAWDDSTLTLYLRPANGASAPERIEAIVAERGLTLQSGAVVRGLRIDGYAREGVLITGSAALEDCAVEAIGDTAVRLSWDSSPSRVRGCVVRDALIRGIAVNQDPAKAAGTVIERNRLERIGMEPGRSGDSPQQAIGIDVTNGNAVLVQLNRLEDIGYAGINLHSSARAATPTSGYIIRRNVVRRAMATLNDGAGIRIVCDHARVEENIVLDTIGDLTACQPWTPLGHGIWAEFVGHPQPDGTILPFAGNRIERNTVYGSGGHGVFLTEETDASVRDNVLVSNWLGGLYLSARTEHSPQCRHEIHGNLLAIGAGRWRPFPGETPQRLATWARRDDFGLVYETEAGVDIDYGTMTGNRFLTPSGRELVARGRNGAEETLAQWRATEPDWADAGAAATAGRGYLFINDTEEPATMPLPDGVEWRTPEGAEAGSAVALPPFRSAVLVAAAGSEALLEPYVLHSERPALAGGGRSVLANLSVRTTLGSGRALVVGAVARGGAKDVLVRAAGPALAGFGLVGASRPRLELFGADGSLRASNSGWPSSLGLVFERVGAFPFAANSDDGAWYTSVDGGCSARVTAAGAGEVLVEVYDVSGGPRARLANLSARGRLDGGDAVLIAGVGVAGSARKRLLVRAVGPGLEIFGVTGVARDPRIEVFDAAGRSMATNEDWQPELRAEFAAAGAFPLADRSRDAALVFSPEGAGSWTVHARDREGASGEVLVEVYDLDP